MTKERRQKVANTLKQTRERRKNQVCKVYELKIDSSHLNSTTKQILKMMFIEAKWLYNHAIANNPFEIDTKIRNIEIKVGDSFEARELKNIPSQIKQELIYRIRDSIKSLSRLKDNGYKIGCLKFKSRI